MNSRLKYIIPTVCLGVVAIIFVIIMSIDKKDRKVNDKDRIVGVVLTGTTSDEGWNKNNYDGLKKACDDLDVKLIAKENILENTGNCERAVKELIDEGAECIVLQSYGYAKEIKDVINANKNIVFYTNSQSVDADNLSFYFARVYQARYMSGIIAGMKTKTNRIGYVAAMNNSEVVRGIDAFALGVKRVNPKAKVCVAWTGSWEDKEKERLLAQGLIDDENVDVLTYHQNQDYVVDVAESNNLYSIGYHQVSSNVSEKCLATVRISWNSVYSELIRDFLRGKGNSKSKYWFGVEKDAVKLIKMSDEVTPDIKDILEEEKQKINNGSDVFSGLICDNEGTVHCNEGEVIGDDILLHSMDWLLEGVYIYEK